MALAEWLSRSGIISYVLLASVGKYTDFSVCSALDSGGTCKAQQLCAGVGEGLGVRGLGEKGVAAGEKGVAAGEKLVPFLPWMDIPGGREGVLPSSLPPPSAGADALVQLYGPSGACDGSAIRVAVPRGARCPSRSNSK